MHRIGSQVDVRDFREIRQKQKEWGLRQEDLSLAETSKSPADFARDFERIAGKYGFISNSAATMDMGKTFRAHGAEAGADFDLHLIQICKPGKAAKSLAANPEPAVLMPKFVMAFSRGGDSRAVVADGGFPGSLAESFRKIREMSDEAR